MTPSIDQTSHLFANLLPNWTLIPILTLLQNFGGFHRTLQRVRLANRGRLLLRTPGPVPFGTCICSYVETILSWTCHVYGPLEFRTSLGTSILPFSLSLCTYITRMDVMLDFICMGPVDLPGACQKRQNTKWKIPCPQWDLNPQPFDSKSDALPTELAGLGECYPFKSPYYIHVLPILMYTLL